MEIFLHWLVALITKPPENELLNHTLPSPVPPVQLLPSLSATVIASPYIACVKVPLELHVQAMCSLAGGNTISNMPFDAVISMYITHASL